MSAFEEWMSSINLGEFAKPLEEKGYDIYTLKELPAEDLNELGQEIGLKKGHIIKLRAYVQKYNLDASIQQLDSSRLFREEKVRIFSNGSELPPINEESQNNPPNSHDALEFEKRPIPALIADIESKETSNHRDALGDDPTIPMERLVPENEIQEVQGNENDDTTHQEPLEQLIEKPMDKELTCNEISESEEDQQKTIASLKQEECHNSYQGYMTHDQISDKNSEDSIDQASMSYAINEIAEKNHTEIVHQNGIDVTEKNIDSHLSDRVPDQFYTEPEEHTIEHHEEPIRKEPSENGLFIDEHLENESADENSKNNSEAANSEEENELEVELPQKRSPLQTYELNIGSDDDQISEQFKHMMGILNKLVEQKNQFIARIKGLASIDIEVPEHALSELKDLQSSIRDFCQAFR